MNDAKDIRTIHHRTPRKYAALHEMEPTDISADVGAPLKAQRNPESKQMAAAYRLLHYKLGMLRTQYCVSVVF